MQSGRAWRAPEGHRKSDYRVGYRTWVGVQAALVTNPALKPSLLAHTLVSPWGRGAGTRIAGNKKDHNAGYFQWFFKK